MARQNANFGFGFMSVQLRPFNSHSRWNQ